jgi:signal transduction histidine kinase
MDKPATKMSNRKKILITDDNGLNIQILEEILADGYQVTTACSGEETLAVLEKYQPDLILIDVIMRGIDGYETCRRIRVNPALKKTKIIMISAKALLSERLKAYDAGADDYIVKPFESEELLAKVRVHLRLKTVEEIDHLKTDLLTLLNHEMRTPLNGITGVVELLLSDPEGNTEERKELLELAIQSAAKLQQLFENVTRLSAMKANKWAFKFALTDIADVLTKATAEVTALASHHQVFIDQELEEIVAVVDPMEIQFVARALLNNAIRFSPAGGRVALALSTTPDYLILKVSDQGAGIEQTLIDHVFDEFNHSDVAHHTEGQRLSLAIAQQVAIAHQGTINVVSQKGSGTSFSLQLPLVQRKSA